MKGQVQSAAPRDFEETIAMAQQEMLDVYIYRFGESKIQEKNYTGPFELIGKTCG